MIKLDRTKDNEVYLNIRDLASVSKPQYRLEIVDPNTTQSTLIDLTDESTKGGRLAKFTILQRDISNISLGIGDYIVYEKIGENFVKLEEGIVKVVGKNFLSSVKYFNYDGTDITKFFNYGE